MIGYFVASGDPEVGNTFTPYLWGEKGLASLLGQLLNKSYGKGLRLLLIQYNVEGKFSDVFEMDNIKVRNYSTQNKDISVNIPVRKTDFHNKTESERRKFLLDSTLNAVDLVQKRLAKRKLSINFDLLKRDVAIIGKAFIDNA